MADVPDRLMKFVSEERKKNWVKQLTELPQRPTRPPVKPDPKHDSKILALGIFEYANRWACIMENGLAQGKRVSDVAKEARDEADPPGTWEVTLFQHNYAVSMLWHDWFEGNALALWWNVAILGVTEGMKALREGRLINTAMMSTAMGQGMIIMPYRQAQRMGFAP